MAILYFLWEDKISIESLYMYHTCHITEFMSSFFTKLPPDVSRLWRPTFCIEYIRYPLYCLSAHVSDLSKIEHWTNQYVSYFQLARGSRSADRIPDSVAGALFSVSIDIETYPVDVSTGKSISFKPDPGTTNTIPCENRHWWIVIL